MFATRLSYIFIIGKGNKPYISLPQTWDSPPAPLSTAAPALDTAHGLLATALLSILARPLLSRTTWPLDTLLMIWFSTLLLMMLRSWVVVFTIKSDPDSRP